MANGNTAKTSSSSSSVSVSRSGPAAPVEQVPAPAPEVPQAPQQAQAPLPAMPKNELMAALSSGFAKAAIGHFGRAAAELLDDPSVVGYYDEIGSDVKQALHDRWNQRDFENFQTQELKPMVEDLEKLEASRRAQFNALNEGKVIDPQTGEVIGEIDPQSVEAVNLKANMERNMMGEFTNRTTRMMEAAQRHGSNPLVDAFMAQYMTNASTTINGIISPATKGIGPQEAADIRYKNAMANQARTASKLNAAQTDRLAKEAQDLSNMSDVRIFSEVAGGDVDNFFGIMESHPVGRDRFQRYRDSAATELFDDYMESKNLDPALEADKDKGQRWLAMPKQQAEIVRMARREQLNAQPNLLAAAQASDDPRVEAILDTTAAETRIALPLKPEEVQSLVKNDAWPWVVRQIDQEIANNPSATVDEIVAHASSDLVEKYIQLAFVPGSVNAKQKNRVRGMLTRLVKNRRSAIKGQLKGPIGRGVQAVREDVGALLQKTTLFGESSGQARRREKAKRTILEGK